LNLRRKAVFGTMNEIERDEKKQAYGMIQLFSIAHLSNNPIQIF
jgi:hypothetical protein